MAELVKSPVWHPKRHEVLKRGVEAFFANDHIPTIHILVPEIEIAIRSMAGARCAAPKTKSNGSRCASLTMMFKLAQAAQKRWRSRNGRLRQKFSIRLRSTMLEQQIRRPHTVNFLKNRR